MSRLCRIHWASPRTARQENITMPCGVILPGYPAHAEKQSVWCCGVPVSASTRRTETLLTLSGLRSDPLRAPDALVRHTCSSPGCPRAHFLPIALYPSSPPPTPPYTPAPPRIRWYRPTVRERSQLSAADRAGRNAPRARKRHENLFLSCLHCWESDYLLTATYTWHFRQLWGYIHLGR